MAVDVVIGDVLDWEERGRGVSRELNERLNQARPDVPMPASGSLTENRLDLVRMGGREVGELGGVGSYEEYMGGGYEPVAVLTDEEKDVLMRRWKFEFPDVEVPYDLGDKTTGMIEYEMMLNDLRRRVLKGMGELAEGYGNKPLVLSEVETVIETGLDISNIRNRRIRRALESLGGEDFVRDVWTGASGMTLVPPANENVDCKG